MRNFFMPIYQREGNYLDFIDRVSYCQTFYSFFKNSNRFLYHQTFSNKKHYTIYAYSINPHDSALFLFFLKELGVPMAKLFSGLFCQLLQNSYKKRQILRALLKEVAKQSLE